MPQQARYHPINSLKTKPPHSMEIVNMSLALVSLFNADIDCFTLVKMADSFDTNLELNVVRLEVLHLRLARWGDAAGLGKHVDETTTSGGRPLTYEEAIIKKPLEQIQARFTNAVKVVQDQDTVDDIATASVADFDEHETLVENFHNSLIMRHACASVTTRAKWATKSQRQTPELRSTTTTMSKAPTSAVLCTVVKNFT